MFSIAWFQLIFRSYSNHVNAEHDKAHDDWICDFSLKTKKNVRSAGNLEFSA